MADDPGFEIPQSLTPKRRGWLRFPSADHLDDAEAEEIRHLAGFAMALNCYSSDFYYSLVLFDFARMNSSKYIKNYPTASDCPTPEEERFIQEMDIFRAWSPLAARDGAMTLFHFSKTLDALKACVANCPSISRVVDHDEFRDIRRSFKKQFPDFEGVRHGVAHSGELLKDQKRRELNSVTGPIALGGGLELSEGAQMMGGEIIINRHFKKVYEGRLVSYELSPENWQFLEQLVDRIYALLKALEHPSAHTD